MYCFLLNTWMWFSYIYFKKQHFEQKAEKIAFLLKTTSESDSSRRVYQHPPNMGVGTIVQYMGGTKPTHFLRPMILDLLTFHFYLPILLLS